MMCAATVRDASGFILIASHRRPIPAGTLRPQRTKASPPAQAPPTSSLGAQAQGHYQT